MHQTKLIQLLKGLTPEEINRFSKFVQSPFYNSNPTVTKLFGVLKHGYPSFSAPYLEKEKVFQKLYPGKPFHYQLLSNLRRQLALLVEEYFVVLENERDGFLKQRTLVRAYGRRGMYGFFEKGTGMLLNQLETSGQRDANYYLDVMSLKMEYFYHPHTNRLRTDKNYSVEILEMLDRFFVLNKIKFNHDLNTITKSIPTSYENNMLSIALENARTIYSTENPVFDIYSNIFYLQKENNDPSVFAQIKEQFIVHKKKFSTNDLRNILYELINYSVRKINQGRFDFNQEAFDLYQFGLQYNLIVENQKMTESTFGNIVSIASALDENEWAVDFIKNYSIYLDENIRDDVKAIYLGEIEFRQKKYDKVLDRLTSGSFSNIFHQLKVKFRITTVWFEKFLLNNDYFDLLTYQIDAFIKFLSRQKTIARPVKEGYSNFLKVLKLICKNRAMMTGKAKKENLIKKINNYEFLIGRVWLIQKIEKL